MKTCAHLCTLFLTLSPSFSLVHTRSHLLLVAAGRMHVSLASNGGELLPHSPEPDKDQCSKPAENMYCFKAGECRDECRN